MPHYVLDTDIASLYLQGHSIVTERVIAEVSPNISVTIVTAQEMITGWLPQLTRRQPKERYVWAYAGLRRVLDFLRDAYLLDFDMATAEEYERLRATYRRLGTNDLRIAAIVLTVRGTLVTRNTSHFSQIVGLNLEDWSTP